MKNNLGENIYSSLRKNYITTWIVIIGAVIISIASLYFSFLTYKDSSNHIFAISEKGDLIPLSKLEDKESELIQLKANIAYFVDNYYSLSAMNMKRKREKVLWMVGQQPTEILKDKNKKGYFETFLSVNGLEQSGQILENTLKISNTYPYVATFTVKIERSNNGVKEFYECDVNMTIEKVKRNYPYNPYGFLITQLSENLRKIAEPESDEEKAKIEASEKEINQNETNDTKP